MTKCKVTIFCGLLLGLTLASKTSSGQSKSDSIRTQLLDEVTIQENRYQKYISANSVQHISKELNFTDELKSLNTIISEQTAIYLKNYGSGMLSTIALRGTTSSQTATFWNGININYPFLGQFDYSLAPSSPGAHVSVIPGGSSSVFGSDAIGGSVVMESIPHSDEKVSFTQQFGSFTTLNSSLNLNLSSAKLQSVTNIYFNSSVNNFQFDNYTKPGTPTEQQENATYKRGGIIQDFYYSVGKSGQIKTNLWFNYADREIQPAINSASRDTQVDKNVRVNTSYTHFGKKGSIWNFQVANINDQLVYNKTQETSSNQVNTIIENEREFNHWSFKGGWNSRFYTLSGDNYESQISEFRTDLYLLSIWTPAESLTLNLNLRQSYYPEGAAPFTPSAGINWDFHKREFNVITLKSQVSRNFRYPTLNDRYWNPGGNTSIKPEDGVTFESSLHGESSLSDQKINWNLTFYRTWVNNMIVWLPQGSFWSPVNYRSVDIYGLESSIDWTFHFQKYKFLKLKGAYNYTRSINRSAIDEFDRSENKQLPYTPIHNLNLIQSLQIKGWGLRIIETFTGEQYSTTDNEEILDHYLLINLQINKSIAVNNFKILAGIEINNLLDSQYQQLRNRPMPGRNYMFTLSFKL